jgi:tRNA(Ile)-lysidine synthase
MEVSPRERVSAFIRCQGLTGARLVVAVSGGPDSVCLLHILASLKDELCLSLHIAHLDHQLRAESASDACYVKSLAASLDIPATLGRIDVQAFRLEKKLSLEEAARTKRYEFLGEVSEKFGTGYIAIGHTQDDHLETILLHIIRGTGTRGLVGLKPLTPWTIEGRRITLVRPMLEITRRETQNYCQELDLNPRLDKTNLLLTSLRNKIRLKLLPMLKSYNTGFGEALLRLSENAREEHEYLDSQALIFWDRVVQRQGDIIRLDKEVLVSLPPVLQRYLLRRVIERLLGTLKDIESRHIEEIMSALSWATGRHIDLPYGLVFTVDYDNYWLGRAEDIPTPFPLFAGQYHLNVPGTTDVPGWRVNAMFVQGSSGQGVNGLAADLDAEKTGQGLIVRTRQPADRFQPLGMTNIKKLGEFMVDAKIPRRWRADIPVVASMEQIIWLVGYRLDERVKVTPQTKRVLRLEFKQR